MAEKTGRPWEYLTRPIRKEDHARAIAERDGIRDGLVCVLATIEPCYTVQLVFGHKRPRLVSARRKCLFIYYYFIDPDFGLMHIRLQTWLPFTVQVYVNGHDWLARRMDRKGIGYVAVENAFVSIEAPARAQSLADEFARLNWPARLEKMVRRVNPLCKDLLSNMNYYWTTAQAEYATDVMFRDRASLRELYERLLHHAALCLRAEDILTFLGKKVTPRTGEVVTDYKKRIPGARIKHWMKQNCIKMYDKHGTVLRVETVINNPYEFKVRREGKRHGAKVMGWFPMAKGVAHLPRYVEVSRAANRRYLDALAVVDSPKPAYHALDNFARAVHRDGRSTRGFNPIDGDDLGLFHAVMRGEHSITGFRNRDVRRQLHPAASDPRQSARVSRALKRLHIHGLIAKIPRSRRWRVTDAGNLLMSAAVRLREEYFPDLLQRAA
jgi:hypothetical protein